MMGLVHVRGASQIGSSRFGLPSGRMGFILLVATYLVLIGLCLSTLAAAGDLNFGRTPWDNLLKTVGEFTVSVAAHTDVVVDITIVVVGETD